jgi:hypothetical protein
MEVKGTAFLARKSYLSREHGAARFDALVALVAERDPIFRDPIVATTPIPVDAFLRFNEAVVRDLCGGDDQSYFRFGAASADWALTEGPYKHLVADKSVARFAASAPIIYRIYFTDGEARAEASGADRVDTFLTGIEPHHVYFEYAVMGYFARGLGMITGGRVEMKVHRGFSRGDADVHYEFRLEVRRASRSSERHRQ